MWVLERWRFSAMSSTVIGSASIHCSPVMRPRTGEPRRPAAVRPRAPPRRSDRALRCPPPRADLRSRRRSPRRTRPEGAAPHGRPPRAPLRPGRADRDRRAREACRVDGFGGVLERGDGLENERALMRVGCLQGDTRHPEPPSSAGRRSWTRRSSASCPDGQVAKAGPSRTDDPCPLPETTTNPALGRSCSSAAFDQISFTPRRVATPSTAPTVEATPGYGSVVTSGQHSPDTPPML